MLAGRRWQDAGAHTRPGFFGLLELLHRTLYRW